VGIDTFFALLTKALLEKWADGVGWVFVFRGCLIHIVFVDVGIEGVEEGFLLFEGLFGCLFGVVLLL
jgi:hypothetical protein